MIHEKLKQRRIELGLTQKQVCDKIGMNRVASISDFERGKKGLSSKKINQLMNLYGLEVTYDMSDVNAISEIFETIEDLFNLKQNYHVSNHRSDHLHADNRSRTNRNKSKKEQ